MVNWPRQQGKASESHARKGGRKKLSPPTPFFLKQKFYSSSVNFSLPKSLAD